MVELVFALKETLPAGDKSSGDQEGESGELEEVKNVKRSKSGSTEKGAMLAKRRKIRVKQQRRK